MGKLIATLVVLSLLLVGCGQATPPDILPATIPNTIPAPSPSPTPIPSTNGEDQPSEVILPDDPPENITWISPGKVLVGNFYPGARAEWDLLVHNGNDTEASFEVKYRYPDHVGEGYVKPTNEVQDWVIVADSTLVLMPRETRAVLIVLAMPKDTISPGPKWEFWISVKETTQMGMVQTELASRWLVTMR